MISNKLSLVWFNSATRDSKAAILSSFRFRQREAASRLRARLCSSFKGTALFSLSPPPPPLPEDFEGEDDAAEAAVAAAAAAAAAMERNLEDP